MVEILTLLKNTGIPFAYDHFAPGQAPPPPFICYLKPESRNFSADGVVYLPIERVHVELYTDRKTPEIEAKLESAFRNAGVFFDKTETYIETENLYEVLYSFEVKGEN